MRRDYPIPITALTTVEYTPQTQDAARYERERRAEIDRLRDELTKIEPLGDEATALSGRILDLEDELRIGLEEMKAKHPKPMTFILQVPTSVERDMLQARLATLGLMPVTTEIMRATMIDELFNMDWGKGSQEANEEHAEDLANFLDGIWLRQEAHDATIERWQEQEIQRVLDEQAGAPARDPVTMPPKIISVRDNAKAQLIIERMMLDCRKLRALAAKSGDYARETRMMHVRLHVVGGTNTGVELARDPLTNALPEEQAVALREKMDDRSWIDLVTRIDAMYRLDGYEEKNSDLPLERPSSPGGSAEQSDGSEANGGEWTNSSTTPAPADESETIIEPSSGSTSDPAAPLASTAESSSPTDGR